jgi:hypothetical protein
MINTSLAYVSGSLAIDGHVTPFDKFCGLASMQEDTLSGRFMSKIASTPVCPRLLCKYQLLVPHKASTLLSPCKLLICNAFCRRAKNREAARKSRERKLQKIERLQRDVRTTLELPASLLCRCCRHDQHFVLACLTPLGNKRMHANNRYLIWSARTTSSSEPSRKYPRRLLTLKHETTS